MWRGHLVLRFTWNLMLFLCFVCVMCYFVCCNSSTPVEGAVPFSWSSASSPDHKSRDAHKYTKHIQLINYNTFKSCMLRCSISAATTRKQKQRSVCSLLSCESNEVLPRIPFTNTVSLVEAAEERACGRLWAAEVSGGRRVGAFGDEPVQFGHLRHVLGLLLNTKHTYREKPNQKQQYLHFCQAILNF